MKALALGYGFYGLDWGQLVAVLGYTAALEFPRPRIRGDGWLLVAVCVLCAVWVGSGGRRGSSLVEGVAIEAEGEAIPEPKGRAAREIGR